MALYAVDEDDLIFANSADPSKIYFCIECFAPVKRRRGRFQFAHFYHLKASPSCRLYSKSERHLIAQIELKKYFSPESVQIEKPFIQINRVADGCWGKKRIIFEIQCSQMTEKEAEMRIRDYQSIGYEIVWLLDEKNYNKRILRPVEAFLRTKNGYYFSIRPFKIYDQFEIFFEQKRVKQSRPMPIHLQKIYMRLNRDLDDRVQPKQVSQLRGAYYFSGDRFHRALHQPLSMLYWRSLEKQFERYRKEHPIRNWIKRHFVAPYFRMLQNLLKDR